MHIECACLGPAKDGCTAWAPRSCARPQDWSARRVVHNAGGRAASRCRPSTHDAVEGPGKLGLQSRLVRATPSFCRRAVTRARADERARERLGVGGMRLGLSGSRAAAATYRSRRRGDRAGRGGKRTQSFGYDERVAAQHDGDVMVPAGERAALEVVEPELALELLVSALGLPTLLDGANDLPLAQSPAKRRQNGSHQAGKHARLPALPVY